ncbi:MAG: hypothetical protein ACFFCP_15775 [Promethearchaeota archaeon]
MIDDDFETVFRKMMESFMETFGAFPDGKGTIRSWTGSFDLETPLDTDVSSESGEPIVEKIDLGDSILFLIQGHFDSDPEVRVNGQKITVKLAPETQDIALETGIPVDLKRSSVSNRNGVLEINAVKAENKEVSEGYLKIE